MLLKEKEGEGNMLKKIILSLILISNLVFGNNKDSDLVEIFEKDGKLYIKGTEKLYTGYTEYINRDTGKKEFEEDYKNGVVIQEREYYESGTLKSIKRYADKELFMEERFFEDGTLYEKRFYKDGKSRLVFEKDGYSETFYSPEGRTKTVKEIDGEIYKRDVKEDILGKDIEIYNKYYESNKIKNLRLQQENTTKVWEYGIFNYSDTYGYDKDWNKTRKEISYEKENILTINDNGNITTYFPNGNKSFEQKKYRDEQGKEHFERRSYDESEKLISEVIEINDILVKKDIDKREKYLQMKEEDKPYKTFYSNGKLAYEKYFEDNKKIERYFNKNGILTYEKEDFQKECEIDGEELWADKVESYKKIRKLRNIKKFTPEGKIIYDEKFKEDNKKIEFQIISYHPNGKIYYDEIEVVEKGTRKNKKIEYQIKRYGENGKIKYIFFVNKEKANEKMYDDNGRLYYEKINTLDYVKREEIEREIWYYTNGKIREEKVTFWGSSQGELTSRSIRKTYSINGELKKETKEDY